MIYPLLTPASNFHLIFLSLLVLKAPLILARNCVIRDLGLDEEFWNIEILEYILPIIHSIAAQTSVAQKANSFVQELVHGQLTSGPQFLKFHPAQESVLDFPRTVFRKLAAELHNPERFSLLVWWIKFERLLISLVEHDPAFKKS